MAVYALSPASIANSAARLRKLRIWGSGIATALLLLLFYLRIHHSTTIGKNFDFLGIVFFVLLINFIQPYPWRRTTRQVASMAGDYCIKVTPNELEIRSQFLNRKVARNEIVRIEDPTWGNVLYVRTSKRSRWIPIPRRIEGYEEIKSTFTASGIPVVQTTVPPGWEGYLFALLYCGSLLCDIFLLGGNFAAGRIVLIANLGVAFLLGIYGFKFSTTIENPALRLKVRIGSQIPLAMIGLMYTLRLF
jgi:hypothetical protein